MAWLIPFLITWIVTTISFIIITKLPTGVESDSFGKTAQAALIFGLLNGVVNIIFRIPVLSQLLWLVTLGGLLLNLILFGLSAKIVEGFRLRWGIWSALIGAFLLVIINSILFRILAAMGI
jgi:putative membrane protein